MKEIVDDGQIKGTKDAFNFTLIKDIKKLDDNKKIDLLAFIHNVGPLDTISLKSGRSREVRRMILGDNSEEKGVSIQATFWGEKSVSIGKDFKVGDVIVLKDIKVGSYNGKSLNVSEECYLSKGYTGREA